MCLKNQVLYHYHLSRFLSLFLSYPLVSCVFPLFFPVVLKLYVLAQSTCFWIRPQRMTCQSMCLLALSMVDEGKSRIYVRADAKNEWEGRGQTFGNVFSLQAFCTGSSTVLIRLPKKKKKTSKLQWHCCEKQGRDKACRKHQMKKK